MQIEENFLNKEDFSNLKKFVFDVNMPWYFREETVNTGDSSYFTYIFFNNDTIFSNGFNLVKPILDKLKYSSLIQVRANLVLREKNPVKQGWHTDYDYKNFKTSIFYLNECNGPTIVQNKISTIEANKILKLDSPENITKEDIEKGQEQIENKTTKIYPKENKILIMDGNTQHTAISQTDTKRRVVININYYEKY
jgi:hypothetical protein|tara:strand:- start:49 stop:633 length:585 start_codon:yes stop_codon:yes gene_type:complete